MINIGVFAKIKDKNNKNKDEHSLVEQNKHIEKIRKIEAKRKAPLR
jgi:hypothetical protein